MPEVQSGEGGSVSCLTSGWSGPLKGAAAQPQTIGQQLKRNRSGKQKDPLVGKTEPIMSKDDERFMAFTGLIQWTQGVVLQSKRIIAATEQWRKQVGNSSEAIYAIHCEHHYFVIAAYKLIEYREWVRSLGLCGDVDFSEIDSFSRQDLKDLRNMREHIVEYFRGDGREKGRWMVETPEYKADASSSVGTMIGGRLDYAKFASAAEQLLSELRQQPMPYPSHSP